MYDIIIIGGGAAGLFAGANIPSFFKTLILERGKKTGVKLLMSGSGQCNLTNDIEIKEFYNKYGENGRFLKKSFYNFDNKDLMAYFEKRGVEIFTREDGKVFPKSLKSSDVKNLLVSEISKNGHKIAKETRVKKIYKVDGVFVVQSEKEEYKAKKLLIATGGKSYESSGSSGDGYSFAKSFGHKIIELKPTLTPLFLKEYSFSELSGISLKVELNLYREGKKVANRSGDLLFTHKGLSGPLVIDFSRYVESGDELRINYMNGLNSEEFEALLLKNIGENSKKSLKNILYLFKLPERFINKIIDDLSINAEIKGAEISKKNRKLITKNICEASYIVDEVASYNVAMATSGGVDLKEINPKSMESKLVENLYFSGEVVDIDGDTGGYNIQAAFSMAYAFVEHLENKK